jgi:hypothetical protein
MWFWDTAPLLLPHLVARFCQDPDSALLDSDFVPSIAARVPDLAECAIEQSQGQGNKDEERNESVRADSSSFKFLGLHVHCMG